LLKVTSNSSSLIHLAKIEHLNLLRQIFGEIIVPEAVYNECVTEGKDREDARRIEKAGGPLRNLLTWELNLGNGEAETIAYGYEKKIKRALEKFL